MRAFITGGGGFLSSRLTQLLSDAGHDVFVTWRRDYDLTDSRDAAG